MADFIHAPSARNIVWTKGATESLNLLAQGLMRSTLLKGSEILLLISEHHANLLPWRALAEQHQCRIVHFPVSADGTIDYAGLLDAITDNTALVACAHVSNALGTIHPVTAIAAKAKHHEALLVVDGSQAVAHMPVDVQALGCDAYVFSGHKMCGPTGIGVLYGTTALLEALPVYQLGGEMVSHVSEQDVRFQAAPLKFEAGTPPIHAALGLAAAANFMQAHQVSWYHHEQQLLTRIQGHLNALAQCRVFAADAQRVPLVSFVHDKIHSYDLLQLLAPHQVSMRVGQHCAMPLQQALGIDSSARISLAAYNTTDEVDRFFALLDAVTQPVQMPVPQAPTQSEGPSASSPALPLAKTLANQQGHSQINRALMLNAKACPQLADALCTPDNLVNGCEAAVYLAKVDGQWHAHTPSKIIRGLLAVLLEKANSPLLLAENSESFDYLAYLAEIGVLSVLSESRISGLQHINAFLNNAS
jgi:cysteine desulfurase/selenocysteine lyase